MPIAPLLPLAPVVPPEHPQEVPMVTEQSGDISTSFSDLTDIFEDYCPLFPLKNNGQNICFKLQDPNPVKQGAKRHGEDSEKVDDELENFFADFDDDTWTNMWSKFGGASGNGDASGDGGASGATCLV